MAYKLIGQNFVPHDVVAKVTGRAKYAEDFRADGMVFCKLLTSPMPHAKIRNIDASEALKMPGVLGILTADDVPQFPPPQRPILQKDEVFFIGDPILALAAVDETTAADALEKIKIDLEQLPHVLDPLDSLYPGGPNARSNGNVAAAQINLQTVKWQAGDFGDDNKLPMGKPAESWTYGDLDAAFKASKLVIEESFVTAGYSHHSMEPRTAMAYWQGGKCFLYGSNQSHTAAVPNIARYIGIEPKDLVFIAEYCGGGFGSKIPGYPIMAIPALLSKKLGRPVMMRITRIEEYSLGTARPTFQGHAKLGFREDGKLLAADLYVVQENGPDIGGGDFRSAGNALSFVYQPTAMRFQAIPVLTNTPLRGPQRGPGENQLVPAIEPMIDKAARELGIDRVQIRKINAPDSNGKIGVGPRAGDQRVPEGGAGQGRHDVQLGREEAALRPEERQQGDRYRRRPRLSLRRQQRLRWSRAPHTGRQAARPHRRRQSRHLLALRDVAGLGGPAECRLGERRHRARRQPARPAMEQPAGRQPDRIDRVTHQLCRRDGPEGEAARHRGADAGRRARRLRPRQRARGRKGRCVEVNHVCTGSAEGDRARRQVQRQGSSGGHQPGYQGRRGDDRRDRPDRRCEGQPAADRRDTGTDRDLCRDRARHGNRQVQDT